MNCRSEGSVYISRCKRGQAANGTVPITPPFQRAFVPPATLYVNLTLGICHRRVSPASGFSSHCGICWISLGLVHAALRVLPQRDARGSVIGRANCICSTNHEISCGWPRQRRLWGLETPVAKRWPQAYGGTIDPCRRGSVPSESFPGGLPNRSISV